MKKPDRGYPLDLDTPAGYAASRLSETLTTVRALAAGYLHPNPGDIGRAKQLCGPEGPVAWLIGEALAELAEENRTRLRREGDSYAYLPGKTIEDLRFNGGKVYAPAPDIHQRFRNPFDPFTGVWSENLRRNSGKDDLTELRESMTAFGWIEEFPALLDERGVVLVGHRRLAVAKGLGIEPVTKRIVLGQGDAADALRFQIAIASNLGAKPFTPEERKRLAEYLYGERGWTMAKIGAALNVDTATVSRDLEGFCTMQKYNNKIGRPKKTSVEVEMEKDITARVAKGEPINRPGLAKKYGVGQHKVQLAVARVRGRFEAQQAEPDEPMEEDQDQEGRREALDELASQAQDLKMGYEEQDQGYETCPHCGGSGRVPKAR